VPTDRSSRRGLRSTPLASEEQYWEPTNRGPAELVSVPPSSTTPAPRGPPERETVIGRAWLWTNRFPSGAELLARCSLERR